MSPFSLIVFRPWMLVGRPDWVVCWLPEMLEFCPRDPDNETLVEQLEHLDSRIHLEVVLDA